MEAESFPSSLALLLASAFASQQSQDKKD